MVRARTQTVKSFEVSDDPLPIPEAFKGSSEGVFGAALSNAMTGNSGADVDDGPEDYLDHPQTLGGPQIFVGGDEQGVVLPANPGEGVAYASRIQVTQAWRFVDNTSLRDAPEWVDKNWLGYETFSEYSPHKPGPVLRVPDPNSEYPKICRIGDYIVKQAVTIAKDMAPINQIEVWPAVDFHKIFLMEKLPPHAGAVAGDPARAGSGQAPAEASKR